MKPPQTAVPFYMTRPVVFLLTLVLLGIHPASGQTTAGQQSRPASTVVMGQTGPATSPLVEAAKKGKARKKKSGKPITNEDVKRSSGKLTVLPERAPLPPLPAVPVAQAPVGESEIRKAERIRNEKIKSSEAMAEARKEVQSLEKELSRLEDDFYSENDPGFRDEVIRQRYETARKQLEAAREKMRTLRGSQPLVEETSPPPPMTVQ